MASVFMQNCCKFTIWDGHNIETTIGAIMDFRRDFFSNTLGVDVAAVPIIMFLNWAAPSTIPVVVQDNQIATLTWASTTPCR